jgi:hypothetical protein
LYIWGGIGAALLIAGIIAWVIIRRRRPLAEVVDLRPPWEIAFEKLALLEQQNLPAAESFKHYYLELTEISREYLGRIYNVDLMEMTTEEVLDAVIEVDLPKDVADNLPSFLRHADLVKFARYVPELERTQTDFRFAHDAVESVRADFERRQQAELLAGSDKRQVSAEGGSA